MVHIVYNIHMGKVLRFKIDPEKLHLARHRKKLSKSTVGKLIGVDRRSVAYWEDGEQLMNANSFINLCHVYEVSPTDLATQTEVEIEKNYLPLDQAVKS